MLLTVIPAPALIVIPEETKFVPVSVTSAAARAFPPVTDKDDNVGTALVTVKCRALDVPYGVLIVRSCIPSGVADAMFNTAVSAVRLITLTVPTVTPVPATETVVAPFPVTKFVPFRVTVSGD